MLLSFPWELTLVISIKKTKLNSDYAWALPTGKMENKETKFRRSLTKLLVNSHNVDIEGDWKTPVDLVNASMLLCLVYGFVEDKVHLN